MRRRTPHPQRRAQRSAMHMKHVATRAATLIHLFYNYTHTTRLYHSTVVSARWHSLMIKLLLALAHVKGGSATKSVVARAEGRTTAITLSPNLVRISHMRSQFCHFLRSLLHQPARARSHVVSVKPVPLLKSSSQSHSRNTPKLGGGCALDKGALSPCALICAADGSQSERGSVFGVLAASLCKLVANVQWDAQEQCPHAQAASAA